MAVSEQVIEPMVESVLDGMRVPRALASRPGASACVGSRPKTVHVAMLIDLKHFDIKEFPIPEVGDYDILVKVECCGVC